MYGTVKRLQADKGFGFIRGDADGTDYFFHRTGCGDNFDSMREGQKVTFEAVNSPKGLRAESVYKA